MSENTIDVIKIATTGCMRDCVSPRNMKPRYTISSLIGVTITSENSHNHNSTFERYEVAIVASLASEDKSKSRTTAHMRNSAIWPSTAMSAVLARGKDDKAR